MNAMLVLEEVLLAQGNKDGVLCCGTQCRKAAQHRDACSQRHGLRRFGDDPRREEGFQQLWQPWLRAPCPLPALPFAPRGQGLSQGCDICGVEITEGAVAVHKHPFQRSTAFLLGNEGTGLSPKEMEICDFFTYIPQVGSGTASLNVTVAASIVLHHFSVWAGFPERERDGQKFIVADRPARRQGLICSNPEEVTQARQQKKLSGSTDWLDSEEQAMAPDEQRIAETRLFQDFQVGFLASVCDEE
ncbi:uncharacterized protein LOC9634363 isoform X3 [Selaginella moellendorffii]|uniref:uncharacterized protein LOC9634363 isoform X3 n=1 Tax=Selaginella moellendorffii TaxID=88036 RepID=UPI000D1CE8C0|nr:uncharacterized protein LOC9634363 isoform X3 [Selaginella moellendorffii]|eukprot:XP_024527157.1 uncharacterized protein LOC9634363 isoform X3 [Selaginella moellendorffii]